MKTESSLPDVLDIKEMMDTIVVNFRIVFALYEILQHQWSLCPFIADKSVAKLIIFLGQNMFFLIFCQYQKYFKIVVDSNKSTHVKL
jgi:hypothetical protein